MCQLKQRFPFRLGDHFRYLASNCMKTRRLYRFSIASILAFTAIVALAVQFWPESNVPGSRVVNWTEHFWFDSSVGVVQRTGSSDFWEEHSIVSGEGNLCCLSAGRRTEGTTGGSYYSIIAQLPAKIDVGDEFEISPFHTPTSNAPREICEMTSGTMIALLFGNPCSWSLAGGATKFTGRIKIKALDDGFVKIHAEFDLTLEDDQQLKIDEALTIDRGRSAPLPEVERKNAR